MKQLSFTSAFIFCLLFAAVAQTEKGSKLVGGTATMHIGTGNSDFEGFLLSLSPRYGGFVANNVAIGAILPLTYYSYEGSSITSIGLSPFVRGYFGTSATRFLLEGRAGYQHYGYSDGNFDDSSNSFTYGVGAGVAHFINDHVGMEFLLSYDNIGDTETVTHFSNLTGVNLNVGFQIYLPRAAK